MGNATTFVTNGMLWLPPNVGNFLAIVFKDRRIVGLRLGEAQTIFPDAFFDLGPWTHNAVISKPSGNFSCNV